MENLFLTINVKLPYLFRFPFFKAFIKHVLRNIRSDSFKSVAYLITFSD